MKTRRLNRLVSEVCGILCFTKMNNQLTTNAGTRAARVKVVFKLPPTLPVSRGGGGAPAWWPQEPLAYVEWYARFSRAPDPTHLMYSVSKPPPRSDGMPQGKIIPLSQIRQSCQLIPTFPVGSQSIVPGDWTSDNVLDKANSFHVNNWGSMYAYQTVW